MENYVEKIEKLSNEKYLWNIPEQKQGSVAIVGGNSQNFRASVKTAEFLTANYPIKDVRLVLPDALKGKIPDLPGLVLLSSTESGSFASEEELLKTIDAADFNLLIGDFSKNSITEKAVTTACAKAEKPLILTRDAVDLTANAGAARWLMNPSVTVFGSLVQLQKLFRAVYYPKVLTLSQSLLQITETLHKFTLSYPVSLITLHEGQILIAKNGEIKVVPLENTNFSPLSLWNGELATKIVALNLYNPGDFLGATVAALA